MSLNRFFTAVAMWVLLYCPVHAYQNNASIRFEKISHNFGLVKEEAGLLYHDFTFTNTGTDPLVVTDVRVSGGVSATGWTRSPVMPGKSGTVSLEYDPKNKPGKFNRIITIISTGTPPSVDLRLLGEVVPREKTPEKLYPREIGNLRLKSNHLSLGGVARGSVKTDTLKIINLSDESLDLSFSQVPGHISVKALPSRLQPAESGSIIASYDAGRTDEWGLMTHNFRVLINGIAHTRNMVYISADIQEDFSGLSDAELVNAPVISFDKRVFDFDRIGQGESVEYDFKFTNEGNSVLIIRDVRAGCGCTAIEPQKPVIQPGQSGSIKTVFSSGNFRGRQNKSITVISNDPVNPRIILRVTGEVIYE